MNELDRYESTGAGDDVVAASTRRRLIRGLGAGIPVVLTVSARSALATTTCLSPSASASISLTHSRTDREQDPCTGRTPGYWFRCEKTHPDVWAAAGGEGVLFQNVFGSGFPGETLQQVMGNNGHQDQWQLGAHLSAAYLNMKMGWVPESVLSLDDLKSMWDGRLGSYSPIAGVSWGGEQIVTYLQTTMTL